MSELKAYNTKYEQVLGEVYLKSEADKVIAELKDKALQYKVLNEEHCRDLNTQERFFAEQIAELKEQVHDYALGSYMLQARAEKEVRHNKYKRCLAIAMWCRRNRLHASVCGPVEKIDFWEKWRKRWLELAEKFKPNNSTAQ